MEHAEERVREKEREKVSGRQRRSVQRERETVTDSQAERDNSQADRDGWYRARDRQRQWVKH